MLNTRLTEQEMRNQMKSVRVDTILHTMPLTMEDFKLYNIEGLRNLTPQQLQSKQFNLEYCIYHVHFWNDRPTESCATNVP